jgi:hypothetical protein
VQFPSSTLHHSKRHFSRQFPRFFRHALGLGLQSGDFLVQFLPLRGGDPVDDFLVLLDLPEDLHLGGEHTRRRVF